VKRNAADARAFVQRYAEETPHELEALANDVARLGRPELLPLDRTYASLDRVEDYYRLVLDAQAPGARKGARERVARYVGATLIEQAGGRWALDPYEGESMTVTGMRAVPGAVF
jgi:hypothetical protein